MDNKLLIFDEVRSEFFNNKSNLRFKDSDELHENGLWRPEFEGMFGVQFDQLNIRGGCNDFDNPTLVIRLYNKSSFTFNLHYFEIIDRPNITSNHKFNVGDIVCLKHNYKELLHYHYDINYFKRDEKVLKSSYLSISETFENDNVIRLENCNNSHPIELFVLISSNAFVNNIEDLLNKKSIILNQSI